MPPHPLQELAALLRLPKDQQTLALLHQLQELVEPERRHLCSEQRVVLPHHYNAPRTQPARLYNIRQVTAQLYDPVVARAAQHLQELALVVKDIPAQHGLEHGLEHGLALLCSVLHSVRKNAEPLW